MGEAERGDGSGGALRSPVEVSFSTRRDAVVVAIAEYRAALRDFNDNAPDDDAGRDAYAFASYRRPHYLLCGWRRPASTRAGALEALRLALEAERDGDYDLIAPMVRAALAFVEGVEDVSIG